MNTVVKIENLVKRYKELLALDHLNLTINEGEIFGLLGPNGSGKTTTINCLLSLLSYDKGTIEIVKGSDKKVGVVNNIRRQDDEVRTFQPGDAVFLFSSNMTDIKGGNDNRNL